MKRTLVMMALTGALGGGVALVACNNGTSPTDGGSTGGDVTAADGTNKVDFAVNKINLPMSRSDDSIDLDGDGKVDNALSNIITVLSSQGLDTQTGVDNSVAEGGVVILLEATTSDPTLTSDKAMEVDFYIGKAMPPNCPNGDGGACTGGPVFDGTGMFTVDSTITPSKFFGVLSGGKYSSNNPVTTTHPVNVQLKLAIVAGAPAITLNTNGAHIQFTSTSTSLMAGELQGSVKISDLQSSVLPAVAMFLTTKVQTAAPGDATASSIESLFDNGGCTDADGVMAKAMDKIITTCELSSAAIIQNLLSADVQIFDSAGNYKPNPLKTTKDSLSLGIGFTAVAGKISM